MASSLLGSSLRAAPLGHRPAARGPAASPLTVAPRSARVVTTQAYVEQSVVTAVSQQAIAFALVLGAEAAFSRSELLESNKGRPEVVPVAAGAGSSLAATILINSGFGPLVTLGLISGFIGSGAMIYYNGKRTADTTDEDIAPDWPGPKAWPAGMTLISFFALNVFLQGLRAEL